MFPAGFNSAPCLVARLRRHAAQHPDKVALRWLDSHGDAAQTMSYRDLWERSGGVSAALRDAGLRLGDMTMLTFPIGPDFLPALIGCLRSE